MTTKVSAEEFAKLVDQPIKQDVLEDKKPDSKKNLTNEEINRIAEDSVPHTHPNGKPISEKVRKDLVAAKKLELHNKNILKTVTSRVHTKNISDKAEIQRIVLNYLRGKRLNDSKYTPIVREILKSSDNLPQANYMINLANQMAMTGETVKKIKDRLNLDLLDEELKEPERVAKIETEEEISQLREEIDRLPGIRTTAPQVPVNVPGQIPPGVWVGQVPQGGIQQIIQVWGNGAQTNVGTARLDQNDPNMAEFGNSTFDVVELWNTGKLRYKRGNDWFLLDNGITEGIIALFFLDNPTANNFTFTVNDALFYMMFCKKSNYSIAPASHKYRQIASMIPNLRQTIDSFYQKYNKLAGYGLKKADLKRGTINEHGMIGTVQINPEDLTNGKLTIVGHGTIPCGPGLKHILTSTHMSKRMKDQITPDDVVKYQGIVHLAGVNPGKDTAQGQLAVMPIIPDDTEEMFHRLEIICGSIEAGNRPNELIRNTAQAIMNRLIEIGQLSEKEAKIISAKYKLN